MFVKNLHVVSFLGIFSLLSMAFPCIAENTLAGKVVYVSDKLFAVSLNNLTRSIKRGASFFQGDTLKTSELSRVQLRFLDSAVVVLHPETEFRIDAFSYADTTDAQLQNEAYMFIGSLLKGSLRTITGDIGRQDPGSYWLNTPVATIFQAQDANYELVLGNAGLAVAVWEGSLVIENEGGSITLGGDSEFSYALITETTVIPQGLSSPPDLVEWNKEDQITEELGSNSNNVDTSVDINIDANVDKQGQQN